ncbi:MAG TPA: hypothetical protein VHM19_23035 [Polyangiales bacterium]|jgi:hypothetical protein|nr:hypothetical protein [Polyangiales bacterium]
MSPIRESQRALYPRDWPAISKRIRERAANRCECTGQCGDEHDQAGAPRCCAANGELVLRDPKRPARFAYHAPCGGCAGGDPDCARAVRIVLTVAHLDHDPTNNADSNLLALCQRCHLRLDRHEHAKNARQTRRARKAAGELF